MCIAFFFGVCIVVKMCRAFPPFFLPPQMFRRPLSFVWDHREWSFLKVMDSLYVPSSFEVQYMKYSIPSSCPTAPEIVLQFISRDKIAGFIFVNLYILSFELPSLRAFFRCGHVLEDQIYCICQFQKAEFCRSTRHHLSFGDEVIKRSLPFIVVR